MVADQAWSISHAIDIGRTAPSQSEAGGVGAEVYSLKEFFDAQRAALSIALRLFDEAAPGHQISAAPVQKSEIPPSVGTVIRSLRETGHVDISKPEAGDLSITERALAGDKGKSKTAFRAGRLAVVLGKKASDNPYDINKNDEAMAHLSWNDGLKDAQSDAGEDTSH